MSFQEDHDKLGSYEMTEVLPSAIPLIDPEAERKLLRKIDFRLIVGFSDPSWTDLQPVVWTMFLFSNLDRESCQRRLQAVGLCRLQHRQRLLWWNEKGPQYDFATVFHRAIGLFHRCICPLKRPDYRLLLGRDSFQHALVSLSPPVHLSSCAHVCMGWRGHSSGRRSELRPACRRASRAGLGRGRIFARCHLFPLSL